MNTEIRTTDRVIDIHWKRVSKAFQKHLNSTEQCYGAEFLHEGNPSLSISWNGKLVKDYGIGVAGVANEKEAEIVEDMRSKLFEYLPLIKEQCDIIQQLKFNSSLREAVHEPEDESFEEEGLYQPISRQNSKDFVILR